MRRLWLAVPAVVIGLLFFVWPMASILGMGLVQDPGALSAVLTSPTIRGVVWFTLWQATLSTLITLLIGLPIAYVLARYDFPGRRAVRVAVTIPFVLPTVVVAFAFLELIGPTGILGIDLAGTAVAVIAAHVFFNLAVVVRTVGGLWSHIDPKLEHAAATLGASRSRVFRTITFPLLRPAILASSAIVFLLSFTSFGVVLLLGAPRLATIEVEIYRSAALLFDLPTAAALAVLQLIGVTAALVWYSRTQNAAAHQQQLLPAAAVAARPRGHARWGVASTAVLATLISLGPPLVLLMSGFGPANGWGTDMVRALTAVDSSVVDPIAAAGNSVAFGIAATIIAVGVALPAAVFTAAHRRSGRWIDPLLMLPIGSSAVTLGFGFIVGLDEPIDLRSWWGLVPIAHALVAIPFVIRTVGPVIRSIQPRLRHAAATLGAPPRQVWWTVELPMIAPATAAAAALAFVVSLGEFGATLFVARPGGQTMTLAIFRLLGRPGDLNLNAALGMSVALIGITAAAIVLIERLRAPGVGGF